jgi:cell division protein FtsB
MQAVVTAVKALLLPVLVGAGILYFSYHALAGDQGLAAWTSLQKQEDELKAKLADLTAQRDSLDHALSRLRDDTLDLDYVEEIARTKLSYVRSDELVLTLR